MNDVYPEAKPQGLRQLLLMTLAGLVVGLPLGMWVGRSLKLAQRQGIPLPWSDLAAISIAAILLFSAIILAATAIARRRAASPPEANETVYLALQAGVLALAGVMLAAPVAFATATGGNLEHAGAAMLGIVLLFAVQTALNLILWRRSDEVLRRAIAESGSASFWLLQGVFFLWACGEKLRLLPAITSWDAVTVLMGVYLVTSTVIATRRGLS
ncbi:hypothetical protein QH494_18180 [Sphingomonas sp. AR_OL41]|uniref:FtsX-like permease family protein n=1 Tax=Sphingomonas sp. AR_OL41 TaxID=3042729 RepID=UPI0024813A99|nr:FtsX-like permease family protein [Sphingomonas sp. AR_OL41]MDH7974122.1 hypothetical protein [Sphingomonas sp. AR_OL41]